MIRMIVGGIGSGKSASAVHEILTRGEDVKQYANFPITGAKYVDFERLKVQHIVKEIPQEGKKKPKLEVNFDYWRAVLEQHDKIAITIDEAHNVLHARRSMSRWNVIFSEWLVQIRKILGENENNHLTLVTQRSKALDVVARDLCNQIVFVKKVVDKSRTIKCKSRYRGKLRTMDLHPIHILKYYFNGRHCMDKYNAFLLGAKSWDARSSILANVVFPFYESYGLVDFGSGVYV